MRTPEFKSIHDRQPTQGRGFVSVAQRQYLTSTNPDLAHNMERFTSPTEVLPLRASKRRRK